MSDQHVKARDAFRSLWTHAQSFDEGEPWVSLFIVRTKTREFVALEEGGHWSFDQLGGGPKRVEAKRSRLPQKQVLRSQYRKLRESLQSCRSLLRRLHGTQDLADLRAVSKIHAPALLLRRFSGNIWLLELAAGKDAFTFPGPLGRPTRIDLRPSDFWSGGFAPAEFARQLLAARYGCEPETIRTALFR